MMNNEGQDSTTVYSFARLDFCSKYISFALLDLLSCSPFSLYDINWCLYAYVLVTQLEYKVHIKSTDYLASVNGLFQFYRYMSFFPPCHRIFAK